MSNPESTQPTADASGHTQALDDFCADAIRRMRGMKSFCGIGAGGGAARGQARALGKFCRTLRKAFPHLTNEEIQELRWFANNRVHEYTTLQTARAALAAYEEACK